MPKPQQPELRRSERVPALDPDATEAVLSAESVPSPSDPDGPVPAEQQPGHQHEDVPDKPDMDAMAERLGVVAEGDEPDDAPSITEPAASGESAAITAIRLRRRSLALAIGVTAAVAVVVRQVLRRRR